MDDVRVFNNREFGFIRTVLIDNEPWFVGKDVASALGYSNTKDAVSSHVDSEDKKVLLRSENTTLEIPNRGLGILLMSQACIVLSLAASLKRQKSLSGGLHQKYCLKSARQACIQKTICRTCFLTQTFLRTRFLP